MSEPETPPLPDMREAARLLTAQEVATLLRVSAKTVRRLPIRAVPVGTGTRPRWRYRLEDVERWIQEHAA